MWTKLVIHNQKDVKARCIILDGVKDHLIPHLSGKTTARDMWEALKSLFQSKNENHKMVLREKLRDTKMTGSDMVTTYLTWIRQVRDELAAIGETMDDSEVGEDDTQRIHEGVDTVHQRDRGT
jgi:2-phosphoglycerate kinase